MDKKIGLIMELLEKLNLDENTLVMFSSDNGATFDAGGVDTEFFNSVGGLGGRKQDLYEGGIREPFIARWPGKIEAATISDHISVQFDLMATLAELIGVKKPQTDGISFLPALLGNEKQQEEHPYLYFEFPEKSGQVAIRMGKWKGVKSNMKNDKDSPWEIFDIEKDVNETTNVAAAHPGLIKEFEAILKKEHQPSHIRDWEFVNPKFNSSQN